MTTPRTSDEIRAAFLEFFQQKGHAVVTSAGVAPQGDASLLFTNAGMVQFKDVFLGLDARPYRRATSAQKCIRLSGKHNDLENVGRTARHQTFFEMLGNFSFGDYFKRDAIAYAWELITGVFALPPERLVVTVFGGEDGVAADDEARAIWREVTGFGDERIVGLGKKDNFWTMGDTGPCGPCTEIYWWVGDGAPDLARFGDEPAADGSGWVEFWNLVFMQFNRDASGAMTPLPAQSVDTGMGLERITAILQGVTSNYDTDLLRPLVDRAAELAGKPYTASAGDDDVSIRVIADHARLTAVCLSEGVYPTNEKRGSLLRSVMRRAIRHGERLGIHDLFLDRVVARAAELLGRAYPQLLEKREFLVSETRKEERAFRKNLPAGLKRIEEFRGYTQRGERRVMPGAFAFDLHATYGFPLDLTVVLGEEQGFDVDLAGYEAAEAEHARIAGAGKKTIATGTAEQYKQAKQKLSAPVEFQGYELEAAPGELALILADGEFVGALREGEAGELVTRSTPFYGESGGQVGDRGVITSGDALFRVTDTVRPYDGVVVHRGEVERGVFEVGAAVELTVDHALRSATRRNHSATHLLHWALRKVLGAHVEQRGSKVGPDVLRFDYAAMRGMTDDEVARVEDLVNAEVLANLEVRTDVTDQAEARRRGAMMIFEENYGDRVRMLHIGRESLELCGGTHVARTGDIGLFKIVSDSLIGSGTGRVQAVTGLNALAYLREVDDRVRRSAEALRSAPGELVARVHKALDEQRELQRQVAALTRKLTSGGAGDPSAEARTVGDVKALAVRAPVADPAAMREYAEKLRDKLGRSAVLVGAVTDDGRVLLVCMVTKEVTGRFNAGKLVKDVATLVGGSGGGRPDMAQAGGTDGAGLDAALARFYELVS